MTRQSEVELWNTAIDKCIAVAKTFYQHHNDPPYHRTRLVPIVGQKHHKCATALIRVLPYNYPLRLIREPDNRFDPNAVKVVVLRDQLPAAVLRSLSPRDNFALSEQSNLVMLGYVKATEAPTITDSDCEPDAKLVFQDNKPFARLES